MSVAVLIDSSCDVDPFQADAMGLDLLMQTVQFHGHVLIGPNDLTADELYPALDHGALLPEFSPITVDAYANTLERMLGRHAHVLAIHPSHMTPQVFEVAGRAARKFPGRVTVFGSASYSVGTALIAERAAQWLRDGADIARIGERLLDLETKVRTVYYIDSPRYIRLAMDMPPVFKTIPQDAKPLTAILDRQLRSLGFAADLQMGLRMMQQLMQRYLREWPGADVASFNSYNEAAMEGLRQTALAKGAEIRLESQMGVVASAVAGPGAFGFSVVPSN